MVEKILSELQERWGYDPMVVEDLRESLENFGHSCYTQGYLDKTAEVKYYAGFSYGKKEDMDDYYWSPEFYN